MSWWSELALGTVCRIFPSRALLARHDGCQRLPRATYGNDEGSLKRWIDEGWNVGRELR